MTGQFQYIDERYIDSQGMDELRYNYKRLLNEWAAVKRAFKDLPEVPSATALLALDGLSDFGRDWDLGKKMQNKHGIGAVPPKTECECGAGLWARIQPVLKAAK
jgi:hypothetical protein